MTVSNRFSGFIPRPQSTETAPGQILGPNRAATSHFKIFCKKFRWGDRFFPWMAHE